MKVKIIFFSVFLLALSLFKTDMTFAQSPSFVVSPTKVELNLSPGESGDKEITIINNLGVSAVFNLYFEDFKLNNNGRDLDFSGGENDVYSLKNFLTVSDRSFRLLPGQTKKIVVSASLANTVPVGSLHSVLFVETKPETNIVGATRVSSRVGVLFFVRVLGDAIEKGHLSSFDLNGGKIQFGNLSNPQVFISYKNEGNTYLNPYGFLEVLNIFGQSKKRVKISPWFTLPQSTRIKELSLEENFFGVYRLNLYQNRGYQDIIDKDSIIMIRISWLYIIILSILISGLVIGGSLIFKFRK